MAFSSGANGTHRLLKKFLVLKNTLKGIEIDCDKEMELFGNSKKFLLIII